MVDKDKGCAALTAFFGLLLGLIALAVDQWSTDDHVGGHGSKNTAIFGLFKAKATFTALGITETVTFKYNSNDCKSDGNSAFCQDLYNGGNLTFVFTFVGMVLAFFGCAGLALHMSGKAFDDFSKAGHAISLGSMAYALGIIFWIAIAHEAIVSYKIKDLKEKPFHKAELGISFVILIFANIVLFAATILMRRI